MRNQETKLLGKNPKRTVEKEWRINKVPQGLEQATIITSGLEQEIV